MPDLRVWFYLLLRNYLDSLRLFGLGFLAFYLTLVPPTGLEPVSTLSKMWLMGDSNSQPEV